MPPKPQFICGMIVTVEPGLVAPKEMLKRHVADANSGRMNWLKMPVPMPIAPMASAAAVSVVTIGRPVDEKGAVVIEPPAFAPPQTMPSLDV